MSITASCNITIVSFKTVKRHPYLRALADIQVHGLTLRGIRLEQDSHGKLYLGFPGRKIRGTWQTLFEPSSPQNESLLLDHLSQKLIELEQVA